jgi:hypothetical protein
MITQPHQEPFKQALGNNTSTVLHLTSSPFVSPPPEAVCLSPGKGLQEEYRRLQQCICELLIKNQRLRMLLESANEAPGQGASPLNTLRTSEETMKARFGD